MEWDLGTSRQLLAFEIIRPWEWETRWMYWVADITVYFSDLFSPFSPRNVLQQTVPVRFKGHSKWQNIKHIKAANDLRIGKMCNKYAHLIGVAIRENKMEKNPEYNGNFQHRPIYRIITTKIVPNLPHFLFQFI